jgi:uncharacterized protein YdaU (DUF1376 family)
MNYYNKHIGDYAKDTAHLSMIEDGAYNRMMDTYYGMEKPLPLDRERLYRLVRARGASERKTVDAMLEEFFTQEADGWHHKRCDEEITKAHEKSRKAKESANNRWHSDGNANAMRTHNEGNAPNSQYSNSQEPIANSSGARSRRKQPAKACPSEFEVTEEMAKWAVEQGVPAERVIPETEKFLGHHRAKGTMFADWQQAWGNWIRKAVEFGAGR